MCAVSNTGDQWQYHFQQPQYQGILQGQWATQAEVNALRIEVAQMRQELLEAKEQDKRDGNPDCEMEAKVALLRKIAAAVGISLDDVLPKSKESDTESAEK